VAQSAYAITLRARQKVGCAERELACEAQMIVLVVVWLG
jgi:hypothetical protein